MLGLLDLRERGERLEPSRFESDPTVTETVRGILEARPRRTAMPVLIEPRRAVRRRRPLGDRPDRHGRGVRPGRVRDTGGTPRGPRRADPAPARPPSPSAPRGVVGRTRRGAIRRGRQAARRRRLLRTRRPGRLPLVGLHDGRPGGGRGRRADRALHPSAARRLDPGGGPLRRPEGGGNDGREVGRSPGGRRADVRDGVRAGGRSHRGAGERLRHRSQATGRRHRGDRRPRGTERARDRRRRHRRSGARGAGPDRAGRARSPGSDVPHHDGS